MNEEKERFAELIARIRRAVRENKGSDRAYLAELRCGLSKTMQDRAWEHLFPYSDKLTIPSVRAVWCTVGGLAAILVPRDLDCSDKPWWEYNFGTTMRILAKGKETGESGDRKLKSFEPRFRRLLSCCDTVLLCEMVASIGKVAENTGTKVNLRGLLWDLSHWEGDSHDDIRCRWSQQFFGYPCSDDVAKVEDKERGE
ncbi:MAG: type I-E CRISPR-associated protein Cse2/CasB [Kiritimatiellae bacterium]|nr:type I-E CRISPR-associated protein Cse2/CasB [Kiritimatiellia bacterium]